MSQDAREFFRRFGIVQLPVPYRLMAARISSLYASPKPRQPVLISSLPNPLRVKASTRSGSVIPWLRCPSVSTRIFLSHSLPALRSSSRPSNQPAIRFVDAPSAIRLMAAIIPWGSTGFCSGITTCAESSKTTRLNRSSGRKSGRRPHKPRGQSKRLAGHRPGPVQDNRKRCRTGTTMSVQL